ncbi:MAG: TetR/AcrR family transcriptional regulator [Sphingobacteriales bacterium]|nr:TetR/AcrR family transcriptional regulator [Sphingobacteriales bacterium]
MDPTRSKIIEAATQFFMRYGIRNVTMDELAQCIGISKKTLYLHISDKETLLKIVLDEFLQQERAEMQRIENSNENAIQQMLAIADYVVRQLKALNLNVMYELRKYYIELAESFQKQHHAFISRLIQNNIVKGIGEGLYRKNIKPNLITRFYIAKVRSILEDEGYAEQGFAAADVFGELFIYHIMGIASEAGLLYLKENKQCFTSSSHHHSNPVHNK